MAYKWGLLSILAKWDEFSNQSLQNERGCWNPIIKWIWTLKYLPNSEFPWFLVSSHSQNSGEGVVHVVVCRSRLKTIQQKPTATVVLIFGIMCNNITIYNRNVILVPFVFKTHTYLGQFFGDLRDLSHLSSHPRFGDGTGRTGTWTVEEGQACYQAPTIRTCCLPFLGFGGKTGLVEGMQKSTVFFFGRVEGGGGVDPCFCFFFFRIWEQFFFFFRIWVFFCVDIRWIQSCFFFLVGVMLSSLVLGSKFRPEKSSTKAATAWCACVAIADDARKNTETPVPGDGEPYARSEKRAGWIWRRIGFWCVIFRLSYWLSYILVIGLCHGVSL